MVQAYEIQENLVLRKNAVGFVVRNILVSTDGIYVASYQF